MTSDMTRRTTAAAGRGSRPRSAVERCPTDSEHQLFAVPALYQSGRAQIGIELRHVPGGVRGRSAGQAHAQTPLSAALAPPATLASWQRPIRVVVGAGVVFTLFGLGAATSTSGQDLAALELFGTVAVIVAAFAGLTAWTRRRAHEQFGAAHDAAATAWAGAKFCRQCGTSWVPGDRRPVGTDRVLGQVLLSRAKADLTPAQR
jgi:hypothetical protein